MSKKGGSTTQTTTLDPGTQAYVNQLRQQSTNSANSILGQPASSFYTGPVSQADILKNAQGFLNPYQQQVIDASNAQFGQDLGLATRAADQRATAAGAFGGDRAGIERGTAEAQATLGHNQQIANLLSSGYQTALNQGIGLTQYNQQLRQQQLLAPIMQAQAAQGLLAGGIGPYGTTSTTKKSPGWGSALLGGALTAGSLLFPPAGAAAAGATALLGSNGLPVGGGGFMGPFGGVPPTLTPPVGSGLQ